MCASKESVLYSANPPTRSAEPLTRLPADLSSHITGPAPAPRFHESFMSSPLGSIRVAEPWHHAGDLARSGGRVRPLVLSRAD